MSHIGDTHSICLWLHKPGSTVYIWIYSTVCLYKPYAIAFCFSVSTQLSVHCLLVLSQLT